jgi:hypothetical protein
VRSNDVSSSIRFVSLLSFSALPPKLLEPTISTFSSQVSLGGTKTKNKKTDCFTIINLWCRYPSRCHRHDGRNSRYNRLSLITVRVLGWMVVVATAVFLQVMSTLPQAPSLSPTALVSNEVLRMSVCQQCVRSELSEFQRVSRVSPSVMGQ